jgi:hypothetical protein
VDGRLIEELDGAVELLVAGRLTYKRAHIVTGKTSAVISECRCAVAKVRHERATKEGAQRQRSGDRNNWKRRYAYVSTMSVMGGRWAAVGNNRLTNFLASGAALQRCYVRRRKRVEDDRTNVATEEEARVKELRARACAVCRKGGAGTHIGEDASGMARRQWTAPGEP